MSQLQPALIRCSRIAGILSILAVSLMLMTGCDRAGEKGETGSWFSGSRVDTFTVRDTITLRDTIVVVDTMLVEKKIILRDTTLVEKEVIKRVEVPAEIPLFYENALKKLVAESLAPIADEETCFSGLNSIEVHVTMNEAAEDILPEQRAKDKFELTLRRYGVPLSNSANPYYLLLIIDALWNEDKIFASYVLGVELRESIIFYRDNKPHKRFVTLWRDSSYGYAGKDVARKGFLGYIEEEAEQAAKVLITMRNEVIHRRFEALEEEALNAIDQLGVVLQELGQRSAR